MTIATALRRGAERLSAASVPEPALDAERLLLHVSGWDRAHVLAEPNAVLPAEAALRYLALVEQRAGRVPLQYLTGVQAFWRHEFLVTPDVLIPRPETEILVEATFPLLDGWERPVVVDVGTGSGCIALSVAAERPGAEVHGIDISAAALAVAALNRRRLGLEGRVAFHEGDLLAPMAAFAGRIHVVLSNPPYVDGADRDTLAPEVRDHEPATALFPLGDAYALYRRLAPEAAHALAPGGWLLLEIGLGMKDEVTALVSGAGLEVREVLSDLQSIPRTVVARRP